MTAGTVLMGIALTLLCALLRAEGTGRALVARSTSLVRLADQFRRNVHASVGAAEAVQRSPRKDGLTFLVASPDAVGPQEDAAPLRSVEYFAEGSTVERLEWTGESVSGRDSFNLGDGYTAKLDDRPGGRPPACPPGNRPHGRLVGGQPAVADRGRAGLGPSVRGTSARRVSDMKRLSRGRGNHVFSPLPLGEGRG